MLTAGQDGRVIVRGATSRRPVHVVDLGAPVLALTAELSDPAVRRALVAARDGRGRLWTFTLEMPTDDANELTQGQQVELAESRTLEISDRGSVARL